MPGPRRPILLGLSGAALAGSLLIAMVLVRQPARDHGPRKAEETNSSSTQISATPTASRPAHSSRVDAGQLSRAAAALKASQTPEQSLRVLADLRAALTQLPQDVAIALIRSFLEENSDAATRLSFQISSNGSLAEAPTLRVFLLDLAAQIDPGAAADDARTILSASASADEWAVSLRNLARFDSSPETSAFLKGKLAAMLQNAAWRQSASAGFLEAFDVAVHTHATELAPALAGLLRQAENRAVAHAAFLTLDRLAIQDTTELLNRLQEEPELMAGREQTRANFFARADLRDPEQRTLLETYLLDPRRTPAELQTFAGLFPNANLMVSNNLLTRPETPARGELIARDREALATIDAWLEDARFERLRPQLDAMKQRLAGFVQQASAAAR